VDILPEMVPLPEEKKPLTGPLLAAALILLASAVALWFALDLGDGDTEQAPRHPQSTPQVAPSRAMPESGTKRDAQRDLLAAERIRSSSPPNQQPLVSEARLSEKQRRREPQTSASVAGGQVPPTADRPLEQTDVASPAPLAIDHDASAPETAVGVMEPPSRTEGVKPPAMTSEKGQARKLGVDPAQRVGDDPEQTARAKIPLIWELDQGLREKLEQLKTTIHVYNDDPSQRFVIINMHRYGEGDLLGTTGYRLHEINRDGIIVDYGDGLVRLMREKY
jgi:hypothetical protein